MDPYVLMLLPDSKYVCALRIRAHIYLESLPPVARSSPPSAGGHSPSASVTLSQVQPSGLSPQARSSHGQGGASVALSARPDQPVRESGPRHEEDTDEDPGDSVSQVSQANDSRARSAKAGSHTASSFQPNRTSLLNGGTRSNGVWPIEHPPELFDRSNPDRFGIDVMLRSTVTDSTGKEQGVPTIYTQAVYQQYCESLHNPKMQNNAVTLATKTAESIDIPEGLVSSDAVTGTNAWRAFRPTLASLIRNALLQGMSWMVFLTTAANRCGTGSGRKRAHPRLSSYFSQALNRKLLMECPVLHADVLLHKIDSSFGTISEREHEADWDNLVSRLTTMDMQSLLDDVITAYAKKMRTPDLDVKEIYKDPYVRGLIYDKFILCLRNDVDDPARGNEMGMQLEVLWLSLVSRVKHIGADPETLNLSDIIKLDMIGKQKNWMGANPIGSRTKVTGDFTSRRRPDRHPLPGPSAPMVPRAPPPQLLAKPTPVAVVDTTKKEKRRKAPQLAASVTTSEKPPAPPPVGAAIPPPAPSRGQRQLVYCGPPAGSTGHPRGQQWSQLDWYGDKGNGAVLVDFDRLDNCVNAEGQRTTMFAVAARARPADRSMQTPRLNMRPSTGGSKAWPADACAFCHFRPKQASVVWCAGTGDGMHNPYRCDPFKRYLAEGGEPSNSAEQKAFLQGCLQFRSAPSN
jgi:hypothetical protein